MTLEYTSKQIHSLAVGGYINGERFTANRLFNQIQTMLRTGDKYIFEIALPDGRWLTKVYRVHTPSGETYDYYIPDTREQEQALYRELGL